ncbi:hypothetical protein DICA0_F36928 [Diutina catenulata]
MSSDILTRQSGPLATVWLAANYDKKLMKHQSMATDIAASSRLITDDAFPLRVSGQLLLGVVRIYSRKTKYLLDDVTDILMKLKTSFKYSTGSRLGSDGTVVNAPARATVVTNVRAVTMADKVTRFDLFYQPQLDLDLPQVFSTSSSQYDSTAYEHSQSVEVGRDDDTHAEESNPVLDFDLGDMGDMGYDGGYDHDQALEGEAEGFSPLPEPRADDSVPEIEVGRREEAPLDDGDISLLNLKDAVPLLASVPVLEAAPPTPGAAPAPRRRRRPATNHIATTTKRRMVVDADPVLAVQVLRDFHAHTMAAAPRPAATAADRLRHIYEVAYKRRRTVPPVPRIREAEEEGAPNEDNDQDLPTEDNQHQDQDNHTEDTAGDHTAGIHPSDHTDVAVPELDFDIDVPTGYDDFDDHYGAAFGDDADGDRSAEVRRRFADTVRASVPRAGERTTLGAVVGAGASRPHAAQCFFEMLAMATNDSIGVSQTGARGALGGDIVIEGKPALWV